MRFPFFGSRRRDALDAFEARLGRLENLIGLLAHNVKIFLANQENTMASIADIQASQAAEDAQIKTLIGAAQTAQASLAAMSAQLAALQAQQTISPADLDAIKADMDAQAAAMGVALAPAAPVAPAAGS